MVVRQVLPTFVKTLHQSWTAPGYFQLYDHSDTQNAEKRSVSECRVSACLQSNTLHGFSLPVHCSKGPDLMNSCFPWSWNLLPQMLPNTLDRTLVCCVLYYMLVWTFQENGTSSAINRLFKEAPCGNLSNPSTLSLKHQPRKPQLSSKPYPQTLV